MPKVTTGFQNYIQQQERDSERRLNGDFIQYMRLSDDGDIVRFRIVSSHDWDASDNVGIPSVLVSGYFHRHQIYTPTGKSFYTSTICTMDEDSDGNLSGECSLCDAEYPRSLQFLIWVWVYYIDHRRQNEDGQFPWEQTKVGAMTVYREKINRFRIWQGGFYDFQALEGRVARYGALTDRDYERIRRGAKGDTRTKYELEGQESTSMDMTIKDLAQHLPDLEKVAMGETRMMDGTIATPNDDKEDSSKQGATEISVPPKQGKNLLDDLPF